MLGGRLFTPKQRTQIIALACKTPDTLGLPIAQWSTAGCFAAWFFFEFADLEAKIMVYIKWYNRVQAHPYRWTYRGYSLAA